ncbi:MAG: hypothetical protein GTO48_01670, partial [Xanthomonadales bacterium]|nr:hypothetical protein [Xanthomonadales bacterium]NIO12291.1 hypothetical protein [Xanthomonadales bacterium]
MALFLLPPLGQGPEAPPAGFCVVVKVAAGAREQLETFLAQQGQQATVAGMEGYRVSGGPGPMAGGGLMGGAQGVVAFADDSTLLAADSEANLQAIAQAYRSGAGAGVSKELKGMLDLYSGSAVRLAVAPPQSILGQIARSEQAPGALGQMTAAAFGLDLDDQTRFKANVRMSSAEAAGQLADQVNATLDQQKQQMQQQAEADPQMAAMVQPMLGLLEKLHLSAEGNDLNVAIDVTPQELQGVMQMAMMMAMSGMMGGPGAGFGGGPPSP